MSEHTHHSVQRQETDHGASARLRRARTEDMDVSLLRIGIYSVFSQSGQTYLVDVFERNCTCPDWAKNEPKGGCKHMRRVDLDIDSGVVPRPDGRLPIPEPRVVVQTAERSTRRPPTNVCLPFEHTSSRVRFPNSTDMDDSPGGGTSDADAVAAR